MCVKAVRDGKEANIGKEEVQISEAVSITFGDFDLVVEAFKLTSIDMELGMSKDNLSADLLRDVFMSAYLVSGKTDGM